MEGWDDLVFTMLTARVPGDPERLLVTPYGRLCSQVTAGSLLKTDLFGRIVEGKGRIDEAGFPIYGAIHRARPDVNCVLHLHTVDGIAVSAQARGLLPLSQTAVLVNSDLGHHDYAGLGDGSGEEHQLIEDLGAHGCMLLRNHGTLTVGRTVADAYVRLYELERACSSQVRALAGGVPTIEVSAEIQSIVAPAGRAIFDGPAGDVAWPALLERVVGADPEY
jgi:ribulose-5-phosphate 4-epimerase/fuculose-1-phosphate aldolase